MTNSATSVCLHAHAHKIQRDSYWRFHTHIMFAKVIFYPIGELNVNTERCWRHLQVHLFLIQPSLHEE